MSDRARPAEDGREPDGARGGGSGADEETDWDSGDDPDMGDLVDELTALEESVDSHAEREQVRETIRMALAVDDSGGVFGQVVSGFDRSDAAESLLGALLFGIPMFVEGGTQEVGGFLSSHPLYFVATVVLTVGLVVGILYIADFQDVRVHNPFFGLIPRKLAGVIGISSLTAVFMMTAWGRVEWGDPLLAASQTAVAFVPMAIGAALGDLLPG